MPKYAFIDPADPHGVPERLVNGGLYTGEVAKGPWGNVAVVPEPHVLSQSIKNAWGGPGSAVGAWKAATTTVRPGNNPVSFPNYKEYNTSTNPSLKCLS